jgi:hypothetical protein
MKTIGDFAAMKVSFWQQKKHRDICNDKENPPFKYTEN